MSDGLTEGTFKNYNNLAVSANSFLKWGTGEPNNAGGNENCAQLGSNIINDYICSEYINIVCERRIPKKPATLVKSSLAPDPEANEFFYYGNSSELTILYFFSHCIIFSLILQ